MKYNKNTDPFHSMIKLLLVLHHGRGGKKLFTHCKPIIKLYPEPFFFYISVHFFLFLNLPLTYCVISRKSALPSFSLPISHKHAKMSLLVLRSTDKNVTLTNVYILTYNQIYLNIQVFYRNTNKKIY